MPSTGQVGGNEGKERLRRPVDIGGSREARLQDEHEKSETHNVIRVHAPDLWQHRCRFVSGKISPAARSRGLELRPTVPLF